MNIRFPILASLVKAGTRQNYADLMNSLGSTPTASHSLLVQMRNEGLISGSLDAYSVVKLEPPGSALYLQLLQDLGDAEAKERQDRSEKDAERKLLFRHNWRVTMTGAIFGAIAGALAGGAVSFWLNAL